MTHFLIVDKIDFCFMQEAIRQASQSIPVDTAYCVGAVLVDHSQTPNKVLSTGFSREIEGNTHAEEVCFIKLKKSKINCLKSPSPSLSPSNFQCTLYTTMEPCSTRLSSKRSCSDLIIQSGIVQRVVCGVKEPQTFVNNCVGADSLVKHGIKVSWCDIFKDNCLDFNRHVLPLAVT